MTYRGDYPNLFALFQLSPLSSQCKLNTWIKNAQSIHIQNKVYPAPPPPPQKKKKKRSHNLMYPVTYCVTVYVTCSQQIIC